MLPNPSLSSVQAPSCPVCPIWALMHCLLTVSLPDLASLLSGLTWLPASPRPHPQSPLSSIRQYELVVHTDIDVAKVYVGEMGRLKSYENQKP